MKLTKVLLANVWSDGNKGDFAITLGIIKLLKKINPNVAITIMSMFGINEFKFLASEYKLLSNYADKIIGSPYPTYFSYEYYNLTRVRRQALDVYSFIISFAKLILIFINKKIGSSFLFVKEVLDSDLVILVGGNYINSSNIFGTIFYLFRVLYPALICIVLKKPYIMLGHSIWNINDRLAKNLLRFIIDNSMLVTVREQISHKVLTSDIGVKNKVFVFPDLAFALVEDLKAQTSTSHEVLTVGFSIRQWNFPNTKNPEEYRERFRRAIVKFIEFLRTYYGAKILLIPLCSGPIPIENDIWECMQIFKEVVHLREISIVTTPFNLEDIFKLYSNLDLHIGVRMHSIIFASMCGIPSIAIGYQGHKTLGIINQLGLSRYYLDINNVNYHNLKQYFEALQSEKDSIRKILSSKVEEFNKNLFTKLLNYLSFLIYLQENNILKRD